MPKKITTKDFEGIETTDPAFRQMMANFDNLPKIDIDPYASEGSAGAEEEASSSSSAGGRDGDRPSVGAGVTRGPRRAARRQAAKPVSGTRTMIPISEDGRDSINMAKQFYCKCEGVKMTREEFLLLVTDKALKKLSPKAYERWKLFQESDGGEQ